MVYVNFTLPMMSMMEINIMIDRRFDLVLYKSFEQFMQEFLVNARDHLQLHQMGLVPEDYWSQIRESPIDGVRYLVWARVLPNAFPACEVRFHEVEERDITQHSGEHMHRAG